MAEIERRIGQAAADRFGLDLSALVVDMNNCAIFIGTGNENEREPIAQRGKAKQRRNDLRPAAPGEIPGLTRLSWQPA